jgi:hypothetical protein
MARFLPFAESFDWSDNYIDRGQSIFKLNEALVEAVKYDDFVYKSDSLDLAVIGDYNFSEFVFNYAFDDELRRKALPWMTQTQHQTLISLLSSFTRFTPQKANTIEQLKQEFVGESCGYIGFDCQNVPSNYVFCLLTLRNFHSAIVRNFSYDQRCQNYEYFNRYFTPQLQVEVSQIRREIRKGKCNGLILDIHSPGGEYEQIHIHFDGAGRCSLNLDGSWRHEDASLRLPKEVIEQLVTWGFGLPLNYYKR